MIEVGGSNDDDRKIKNEEVCKDQKVEKAKKRREEKGKKDENVK